MNAAIKIANRRLWTFTKRMAWLPLWVIVGQAAIITFNTANDDVSNWFKPVSLKIPNHCEGEDPEVQYTRQILKEFPGTYQGYFTSTPVGSFPVNASGTINWSYKVKPLATVKPKLYDLMGSKGEKLSPGPWYATIDWTVERGPWMTKGSATLHSNAFIIWDKSNIRCGLKSNSIGMWP